MSTQELNPDEVAEFLEWKQQQAAKREAEAVFAWQDSVHNNPLLVWAVGATPREAVEALSASEYCQWGEITDWWELPKGNEEEYPWGFGFIAGGTGLKAAGKYVPGGVVVTWWK